MSLKLETINMISNSESGIMGWGVSDEQGGWRKGPWTPEEDKLLSDYINLHGDGRWSSVSRCSGLNRSGKSCRLRWVNYLRPGLKKSQLTPQEEGIIIELHALWGNKWSTIARYLPGRTDNEIKNYWRTHFKKKPKLSQNQEKRRNEVLNHTQQFEYHQSRTSTNIIEMEMPHEEVHNNNQMREAQDKHDNVFAYPVMEQPCWPILDQDALESWSDMIMDDGLWGGLWNVEPQNYCRPVRQLAGTQNQAIAYPCGGADTNNMYYGGNIF